jgi:DNA polymerase-3 subunit alpha
MSFVHLHVHSEYSVLDGLSKVGSIVARAKELGQPAVAITDHGAMYGVIDFFNAAKKADVKPIIGMEGYLARRSRHDRDPQKDKSPYHLLLLAQTQTGYQNLLKLATISQLEGYYYRPRVDKEVLAQYSEGVIVTTGCGAAEIPRYLADGQLDEARKALGWYLDVFGRERFFVELQLHDGFRELVNINRQLLQLAKEFDVRPVATNDAHYIKQEDAPAQDIILCIGTGTLVRQQDRMRMTDNSYYLKSCEEMSALFGEVPQALTSTLEIAEMCNVDLSSKGYHLPAFDLPVGVTPNQELRRKCEAGLVRRYGERANDLEIRQRLDYELEVIHKMGFDTYFLIVSDLTRFAQERDIWWNIRGSGASSIVAYTSGITNLDPLPNKLIFERFLNPARISMPDIDMDFPDDRRAEVINYAVNKYGKDKVAQIITFGTLGARAAIRDTGRALDIPLPDVDRVAKLVPNVPGKPVKISEAIEQIPELKTMYDSTDWVKMLLDTAQTVEGTVRNIGTHAAGVVISDRPLVEYTPLARPTKESDNSLESITQFEMGVVESIGLLKVDFLGLATLTIMRKACDLIKQNHSVELNLNNIPINDRAAFQLMSRGDVLGLFQVEGAGMRRMLMEMKPSKFEHIIAAISLFRPGPMEYIPMYIKRMHGDEPVMYKHPKLEPILEETYGIIVYQEQIIQIAVQLAGYAPGEADEIRKAVGKKIKEKIEAHKAKFIAGAVKNGIDRAVAEAIYADIEYFARYGFNKAHAADYAVMTCQTAYLKAHYPVEYMTALMSVEQSVEKIGLLIIEARRMGIDVLPPSVNFSDLDFTIETRPNGQRAIRFGMASIKGVGESPVRVIREARLAGGPFKRLEDFCRRVDLRAVNRRALEALIKVGALEDFGHRAPLLQMADRMMGLSSTAHRAQDVGQLTLFGSMVSAGETETIGPLPNISDVPLREKLAWEKELIGAYVSEHPVAQALAQLQGEITHTSAELTEDLDGHKAVMIGAVIGSRTIQTKKGDTMGFIQLEDVQGTYECVAFPRTWRQTQDLWQKDKIVVVRGTIDGKGKVPKILLDSATDKPQVTNAVPDKKGVGIGPTGALRKDQGSAIRDQKSGGNGQPPVANGKPIAINGVQKPNVVKEQGVSYQAASPKPMNQSAANAHAPKTNNPTGAPRSQQPTGGASQPTTRAALDNYFEIRDEVFFDEDPFAGDVFIPDMDDPAASVVPVEDFGIPQHDNPLAESTADYAERGRTAEPMVEVVKREFSASVPSSAAAESSSAHLPVHPEPAPKKNGNGKDYGVMTEPYRVAKVVISRTGDSAIDASRVGEVHHLLSSCPGPDRFCFLIKARGETLQLDFPNDTTTLDEMMIDQLKSLRGVESVQISMNL